MIRHGHRFEDIKRYTLAQIELFHHQAQRLEMQESAERIKDIAAALSKDGKDRVKHLEK